MLGLLSQIVPPTVAVSERADDVPLWAAPVEEQAFVAGAVPRRVAEFTTVRECARRCLEQLGQPPSPLLPRADRSPNWPPGIVGSMTHCDGYRAAALSTMDRVTAIGIDAEPASPLPQDVAGLIAHGAEHRMLEELDRDRPDLPWDRLLFSAKESFYKAWHPQHGRFLDFDEVRVTLEPGTFTAQLPAEGVTYRGRWLVRAGLVLTACVLTSESSTPL